MRETRWAQSQGGGGRGPRRGARPPPPHRWHPSSPLRQVALRCVAALWRLSPSTTSSACLTNCDPNMAKYIHIYTSDDIYSTKISTYLSKIVSTALHCQVVSWT